MSHFMALQACIINTSSFSVIQCEEQSNELPDMIFRITWKCCLADWFSTINYEISNVFSLLLVILLKSQVPWIKAGITIKLSQEYDYSRLQKWINLAWFWFWLLNSFAHCAIFFWIKYRTVKIHRKNALFSKNTKELSW